MSAQLIICLIIFVLTIISFLIGKVSMAITALFSMVLLVLTGCISAETALSGFADSSTIIMASMFIISAGFAKTQMVAKISKWVARTAKGSFTYVMLGYVVVTALIAQIVPSAMAVFSIVFPLALGVCNEMNVSPSKMIFSLGIVAISTICVLPFGAGAVYVSQFNGILAKLGSSAQYGFADICVARLPGMLFVMAYAIFLAPKFAPDKPVVAVQDARPASAGAKAEAPTLSRAQEVIGYLVFFGVILGLVVTSLQLIKVPFQVDADGGRVALESCFIPLIGAIIVVAAGLLKPREAYGAIGMGGMRVITLPSIGGGSEDFAYMAERVQQRGGQATYFGILTSCAAINHNDRFDFDEGALVNGVRAFTGMALDLLGGK